MILRQNTVRFTGQLAGIQAFPAASTQVKCSYSLFCFVQANVQGLFLRRCLFQRLNNQPLLLPFNGFTFTVGTK